MAPFIPILSGPNDTRNFDPEFTNLNFDDSYKENSLAQTECGKVFNGFSYNINMNIENTN